MRKILPSLFLMAIVYACGQEKPSASVEGNNVQSQDSSSASGGTQSKGPAKTKYEDIKNKIGEYSMFVLDLSIETPEGIGRGYHIIGAREFELDSADNPEYIKTTLLKQQLTNHDTLQYFKILVTYKYSLCLDNKITSGNYDELCFMEKMNIPSTSVQHIKINDISVRSFTSGIWSRLTPLDTTWMKEKPIRCVNVDGNICSAQVFIHHESKVIADVFRQIDRIKTQDKDTDEDDEQIQNELYKALLQLNDEKVVIVNECAS